MFNFRARPHTPPSIPLSLSLYTSQSRHRQLTVWRSNKNNPRPPVPAAPGEYTLNLCTQFHSPVGGRGGAFMMLIYYVGQNTGGATIQKRGSRGQMKELERECRMMIVRSAAAAVVFCQKWRRRRRLLRFDSPPPRLNPNHTVVAFVLSPPPPPHPAAQNLNSPWPGAPPGPAPGGPDGTNWNVPSATCGAMLASSAPSSLKNCSMMS